MVASHIRLHYYTRFQLHEITASHRLEGSRLMRNGLEFIRGDYVVAEYMGMCMYIVT